MKRKSHNIIHILQNREYGFCKNKSVNTYNGLQKIAEEKAASSEMEEIHCKLPSSVRSTFLMSFSPDCSKVASTHGDHKIYVCDVKTGKLLHKLEGHPRTPWCVVFHPTSNDILASGCLGGEVRVWDLHGGSEQWRAEQNTVITSLTFHPFDKILVIATYNRIHFWNWNYKEPFATCFTNSIREKVRFVKFNCLGTRLITGILNPPDTPLSSESSTPTERLRVSHETFPGSLTNRRRNLWARLMHMYQHIDGSEEYPRTLSNENSPTLHEEALDRARQYAESVTQAIRLQRQLNTANGAASTTNGAASTTNGAASTTNSAASNRLSNNSEISNSHEELLVRAFWRTFNRLRNICSALERRMHLMQRSSEPPPNVNEPSSSSYDIGSEMSSTSGQSPNHNATSEQLINILTRLQNSLQFSAITESVPPEQIQQLQWRISEILERLTNVTGYRARLATLRDHIVEVAERSEQRNEGPSPISRHDLAHCLFLVEMSLQLTRQMQRILQTDYRLIRMHLTNNGSSSSSSPSPRNTAVTMNPSTLSSMCVFYGRHELTTASETTEEAPNYVSRREREFREIRQRMSNFYPSFSAWQPVESSTNSENNSSLSFRMLRFLAAGSLFSSARRQGNSSNLEIPNQGDGSTSLNSLRNSLFSSRSQQNQNERQFRSEILLNESSNEREQNPTLPRNLINFSRQHYPNNSEQLQHNFGNLQSESNNQNGQTHNLPSSAHRSFLNQFRNSLFSLYTQNDDNLEESSDSSEDSNEYNSNRPSHINGQNSNYEQRNFQSTSNSNSSNVSNDNNRRTFYIPDVHIDPSPDNDGPLPRPRSPLVTLSGHGDFSVWNYEPHLSDSIPYFSRAFYEASRRSQFGTHESGGSSNVYRIQAWDFSDYDIPVIMNAKVNVVVQKCKIHNDASISISQSGEILVALVPSGVIDLVTFAVYSLKPENLGQCLYRSIYEGNAISVSLSPCNHYVVVGITPHRLMGLVSSEKEAVAHIYRLKPVNNNEWIGFNVRSLSQQSSLGSQISLNSVQWLPQSGQGLIYGTNKGCLCICKPIAPMFANKNKSKTWKRFHSDRTDDLPSSRTLHNNFLQQVSSTSTQTTEPMTQTTGTQTFSVEGSNIFQ